jgi:hypothetical protein
VGRGAPRFVSEPRQGRKTLAHGASRGRGHACHRVHAAARAMFHTGHATRRGQHACDPVRSCLVLRFSDDSGRELRSFAPFRGLWFMLHDATQGLRPGLHLCRRSAARKDFSHGLASPGLQHEEREASRGVAKDLSSGEPCNQVAKTPRLGAVGRTRVPLLTTAGFPIEHEFEPSRDLASGHPGHQRACDS